jgi:hypothetical protein
MRRTDRRRKDLPVRIGCAGMMIDAATNDMQRFYLYVGLVVIAAGAIFCLMVYVLATAAKRGDEFVEKAKKEGLL